MCFSDTFSQSPKAPTQILVHSLWINFFSKNHQFSIKQFLTFQKLDSTMITLQIEPRRLHRASTQPFRLMKTTVNCVFVVFGSTGNACVLAVSKNSISCNCPDIHPGCKHILFLLLACGHSGRGRLCLSPANLLQKLHADPPTQKLKGALLDKHTNHLCSAHNHPSCFFCNKKPSGTLTICSSCGFLSHQNCLDLFLFEDEANDHSSHCPRCGLSSSMLLSHFVAGHRNFFHILRHQGCECLPPTHTAFPPHFSSRRVQNNLNVPIQPAVDTVCPPTVQQQNATTNMTNDDWPAIPQFRIVTDDTEIQPPQDV